MTTEPKTWEDQGYHDRKSGAPYHKFLNVKATERNRSAYWMGWQRAEREMAAAV